MRFVWISDQAVLVVQGNSVRWVPSISGGSGGGSAGRTQTTQQTSQIDPWLSKINELAYGQIKTGIEQSGGLPAYLEPNPLATPEPAELAKLKELGEFAGTGGDLGLMGQRGLEDYRRAADPTRALGEARDLFNEYASPIIRNEAAIAGQGRGGVVGENLAKGFASAAMPLIGQAQGARQGLAGAQLSLEDRLYGRGMAGLETELRALAAPRELASAERMRPRATIASIVGGLPLGGGTVTGYNIGKTQAFRGDTDVLGDIIIPLIGAIAGGVAACWLATQALNAGDALRFRIYLAVKAPLWERVVYRVLSHRWTRFLAPLVRPWLYRRAQEVL